MSSSTKYTPLDTAHLRSQSPSRETTMQSLIETSELLAQEAREVMPYSFDECTYEKGYLRQSIWSCLDCGEKGVCYGCSISCHSDHRLVELWTKRHFRCDCPTDMIGEPSVPSPAKRRRCTLNPPQIQPAEPNAENKYQHNFSGRFCRCGRAYDPETETEAMINCMACEDWYHESCLNLRVRPALPQAPGAEDEVGQEKGDPEVGEGVAEEDEDEEKDVLIPSESYDGLLCARCVEGCAIARRCRGRDGWMTIEPKAGGGWEVNGRQVSKVEKPDGEVKREHQQGPQDQQGPSTEDAAVGEEGGEAYTKRSAEDAEEAQSVKKIKLELTSSAPDKEGQVKGAGDVFVADGVRAELKATLSAAEIESLPFPLVDDVIYEPPRDTDPEESLDEVTNRVVGSLPRAQAIEALHGYQTMKERLKVLLAQHAERGEIVTRDAIEGFFADLAQGRTR